MSINMHACYTYSTIHYAANGDAFPFFGLLYELKNTMKRMIQVNWAVAATIV